MDTIQEIDELNDAAWKARKTDPEGAEKRADRAGRMSREGAGYPRGIAWSLLTLASCADRRGELDLARARVDEALALMLDIGDRPGEAAALALLGGIHADLGDYPAALEFHRASLRIGEETSDDDVRATALIGIGTTFYALGEFAQAIENYRASLEIDRALGNRNGEGSALNNIGMIQHALGDYRSSLENYLAALEIFREVGNRGYEANALTGLGNVHLILGNFAEAGEYYRESLEIQRETGSRIGEAVTLGNLGGVHQSLGEYALALENFQGSLRICSEIANRKGEAAALSNIGFVHSLLGDHAQAIEHYRASLIIKQEIGYRIGEATSLHNIGLIHRMRGEHREALEHHRAGLEIFREVGDRLGEADALIATAESHLHLGERNEALLELDAARQIADEIGSRATLAQALLAAGRTHTALDNPEAALDALRSALAIAVELGEPTLELEACGLIADALETLGDASGALLHLRRFLALQSEVQGEEQRRKVHDLESAWQIELARREAEIERLRNVELKQAFDELKSAQSSLVQSEKMASLGQLVAGIAHEINNPINFVAASIRPLRRDIGQIRTVIASLAAAAPRETAESLLSENDVEETLEEIDQLLDSIDTGARRTAEIVTGLRSFSRLDEGGVKTVDLHEGLEAALTLLSGSATDAIVLVRRFGELPPVSCYPGEINQLFMNLLTNAIKAIDGEGRVTVSTAADDDWVSVSIADSGCGIAPELRERIFEPFFTTRPIGEGRGLGLSIAWGIAQKHNGTIEVESTEGSGSIFTVRLPRLQSFEEGGLGRG